MQLLLQLVGQGRLQLQRRWSGGLVCRSGAVWCAHFGLILRFCVAHTEDYCKVRMRGLPFNATTEDVCAFFSPIQLRAEQVLLAIAVMGVQLITFLWVLFFRFALGSRVEAVLVVR